MPAGADFRTRITLDGADQIQSDLRKIGAEGDKAFSAVGKSADQASSSVGSFGRATDLAARSMASMRAASQEAAGHLSNIHQHAVNFGSALNDVASNIIPRWREVLALGTAGGIAGFFKLFENTAAWGHELSENAKILGLTPGQFSQITRAASEAGVEVEKLVQGMARFSGEMQKIAGERQKLAGKTAVDLFGKDSAAGLENAVTIYAGASKRIAAVLPIPKMEQWRDVAEEQLRVLQRMGQFKGTTLQQWLNEIDDALRSGGERAKNMREDLNKWGASIPSAALGERIEQALPGFRDLFAQLGIPLFDKNTGEVRKFTDAFGDFLEKFKTLPEGQQFNIVRQNFGRGFTELIPLMKEGRDGLLKFFEAAREAGLDTSAFDKEIESLDQAQKSLNRLDGSIKRVRKSFVVPFADTFKPLIDEWASWINASQKDIKDWATEASKATRAVSQDIVGILQGSTQPTTEFGKIFLDVLNLIKLGIGAVKLAWDGLVAAIEPFTGLLNSVLGKDYTTRTYALAAAFVYFSGILPAVAAGIRLVGAAAAFFGATPIGLALTALALIALTIYQNWDKLAPLFQYLWDKLQAFGAWLRDTWNAIWDASVGYVIKKWEEFTTWFDETIEALKQKYTDLKTWINDTWNSIWDSTFGYAKQKWDEFATWVEQKVAGIRQTLAKLNPFSNSAPTPAGGLAPYAAGGLVSAYAAGGQVPGRGLGDTVPALLTPGEFVIRKGIVDQLGAGFFSALNGGMGSLIPRGRYATGGLVMATDSGGNTVNLHLDGQAFAMKADNDVFESLVRTARSKQMLSAGRKPGWAGGRRYGG